MVDVSSKEDSKRDAMAACKVLLGQKAFHLVASNQVAKGDVLSVAKIAGINGAKQTSGLIPLCHNISLTHIRVDLALNEKDFDVDIEGEATTTGKRGVEMEATMAMVVAGCWNVEPDPFLISKTPMYTMVVEDQGKTSWDEFQEDLKLKR